MKHELTAKRLQLAISNKGIKQQELAEKSGVKKASISQYVNGSHVPSNISSGKLGEVLGVNPLWLMGFDVPMLSEDATKKKTLTNIHPIELKKFPMLGEIACGEPRYANEDRESYVLAGSNIRADFCLTAKGDSMINARIHDGDIVFIRQQDMVENGEIAAVVINSDSEATLKRLYYYAEQALMILKPENPEYKDQIYQGEQLNEVHILGKAIAFQSDVK